MNEGSEKKTGDKVDGEAKEEPNTGGPGEDRRSGSRSRRGMDMRGEREREYERRGERGDRGGRDMRRRSRSRSPHRRDWSPQGRTAYSRGRDERDFGDSRHRDFREDDRRWRNDMRDEPRGMRDDNRDRGPRDHRDDRPPRDDQPPRDDRPPRDDIPSREDRERREFREARIDLTASNDPKLKMSRLFIGNLPSDNITSDELNEYFSQHAKVLGVAIFKGYGFVQLESEDIARRICSLETNTMLKGKRIDVRIAGEGKKRPPNPERRGMPEDDFPPRGGPDRNFQRFDPDYGPNPDFGGSHSDFPPGGMSGPPRRGGFDRDFDRGAFDRPPMDRGPMDRSPMDRGPMDRGPPGRDPGPRRMSPHVSAKPAADSPPIDCYVLAVSGRVRNYAEMVESRLRRCNLVTSIRPLAEEMSVPRAVEESGRSGALYTVTASPQHMEHLSVTLNILHGTPQEHRNMPLEDAMSFIGRNFESYIEKLREKASGPQPGAPAPSFLPKPPEKIQRIIKLLADDRHMTVKEIDDLVSHLKERRRLLTGESEEQKPSSGAQSSTSAAESVIIKQQEELQAKIYSMLGGQSKPTPKPVDPVAPKPPKASSNATNLNFSALENPSVQKALNSLMSGGSSLLQNIQSVSSADSKPSSGVSALSSISANYSIPGKLTNQSPDDKPEQSGFGSFGKPQGVRHPSTHSSTAYPGYGGNPPYVSRF